MTEFLFFLRPFLYSAEGPVPAGRHHAQVSLKKKRIKQKQTKTLMALA